MQKYFAGSGNAVYQPAIAEPVPFKPGNELGVNLFVRTLNGTELTAAGKIYLEYAKEIKLLKETMNSKLKELKREKKSRIRIGMPLNAASLAAFDVVKEVEKNTRTVESKYIIFSQKTWRKP